MYIRRFKRRIRFRWKRFRQKLEYLARLRLNCPIQMEIVSAEGKKIGPVLRAHYPPLHDMWPHACDAQMTYLVLMLGRHANAFEVLDKKVVTDSDGRVDGVTRFQPRLV